MEVLLQVKMRYHDGLRRHEADGRIKHLFLIEDLVVAEDVVLADLVELK